MNLYWNNLFCYIILSLLLMTSTALVSCSADHESDIYIAAASNLEYCLPVIIKEFEKRQPENVLNITYGSSGKLATQIIHGAPYDIFLSADVAFPQKVFEAGAAVHAPRTYAFGECVLFMKSGNLDEKNYVSILSDPRTMVSIPNPQLAPYGRAAFQFLAGVHITIPESRILLADNVSVGIYYACIGADMGFIPRSALFSDELKNHYNKTSFLVLPDNSYEPIAQAYVICVHGEKKPAVQAFADFLISESGQSILFAYGYKKGIGDAGL